MNKTSIQLVKVSQQTTKREHNTDWFDLPWLHREETLDWLECRLVPLEVVPLTTPTTSTYTTSQTASKLLSSLHPRATSSTTCPSSQFWTRRSTPGSAADGRSTVMMSLITQNTTSTPCTTGLALTPCKCYIPFTIWYQRHKKHGIKLIILVLCRLQNGLIWNTLRRAFETSYQGDNHAGFQGVKTHENGVFLYKSHQAEYALKSRFEDYFFLGALTGFVTGQSSFLFLPVAVMAMKMPRKLATMKFFTFHAELLPHTEQVVFHKTNLFGDVRRHYVDIANLEKIDASEVPSSLLF